MLVPRGVFYASKLSANRNETALDPAAPFSGGTAYGNTNTLASYLNSRVIQLVIAKNLTLADAWRILDLARMNSTGVVSSFPFFATSEFYTLGFAWEVSKLAANTSVVNGGNWTAVPPPPPPPNLWDAAWNTIAGVAAFLWNAVVATAQFFINVGKWLIQVFMSVVKGLTTGDWEDFKNQVLSPLVDALNNLWKWLYDLMAAMLDAVIRPIKSALTGWVSGVMAAMVGVMTHHPDPLIAQSPLQGAQAVFGAMTSGYFFSFLFGLWMTLNIVRFYIALPAAPLLGPIGPFLAQTLYRIVLTVAVNILVTTVVGAGIVFIFLPQADPFWREGVALTIMALISALDMLYATRLAGEELTGDFVGLFFALLSLAIIPLGSALGANIFGLKATLFWSIISLILAGFSVLLTLKPDVIDDTTGPLGQVEEMLGWTSVAYS